MNISSYINKHTLNVVLSSQDPEFIDSTRFSLLRGDNKTTDDIHIHYKATKSPLTFLISVCRDDQTAVMCSRGKLTNARGMNRLCSSFAISPLYPFQRTPTRALSSLFLLYTFFLFLILSLFLIMLRKYIVVQ